MGDIEVRDAGPAELVAGSRLLATALRFGERDAIPAWLMQTIVACGGIALAALDEEQVVGFSLALPSDGRVLFSCGLAVAPTHRGRHIAQRLKLAQRERALARGVDTIRWTADPLAAPALSVYLSALGARIVAYEPELYAAVRPERVPPDDVVVDWRLQEDRRARPAAVDRVEIPFAHDALDDRARLAWRLRVRARMCRLLDAGCVGTAVTSDRAARRSWVLFAQEA